jgi:hypothetical protein
MCDLGVLTGRGFCAGHDATSLSSGRAPRRCSRWVSEPVQSPLQPPVRP